MTRIETATDPDVDGTRSLHAPCARLDVLTTGGHNSQADDSTPDEDIASLRHERFQIGTKLGEGGMGVVYARARRAWRR